MNKNKTVTCVIFLYNEENYIKQAIQSVLDQTYTVDEIIVSDDFSTDSTAEIVHSLMNEYPQIKYVLSEKKGKFHAYKTGLKNVTSASFFIMAGDDALETDYVETGLQTIRTQKVEFFYSNSFVCDFELNKVSPTRKGGIYYSLNELLIRNWAGGFLFGQSNIIPMLLSIDSEKIVFEDWVCSILLTKKYGSLFYSSEPKYLYRRHPNATTKKLTSKQLRTRDIKLYEYLLESGIELTNSERSIIINRKQMHETFVSLPTGWSSIFRILSKGGILFLEKIKLLLLFIFQMRTEESLNRLLRK